MDNSGAEGSEGGSVPSQKALNVVPEGTEPDDTKALNHVQSNTAVNPAVNTAATATREANENPAAAAAQKISKPENTEGELTDLLIDLERQRGKSLTIDRTRDRVHVLTWVGKGVTVEQLRAAHAAAVAARDRDTDDRPTYVGFVATFVDQTLAPAAGSASAPRLYIEDWFRGPETVDARGAELAQRPRKPDEDWRYYRVLIAAASKEPRAIEFVLTDAQKYNQVDLYQLARKTFGDALMPVDDYPS